MNANSELERMTTAFSEPSEGDVHAAVAWRGEKIMAVEFFDVLAPVDLDGTYPFRRELRIYEVMGEMPLKMSVEELEDRLNRNRHYTARGALQDDH